MVSVRKKTPRVAAEEMEDDDKNNLALYFPPTEENRCTMNEGNPSPCKNWKVHGMDICEAHLIESLTTTTNTNPSSSPPYSKTKTAPPRLRPKLCVIRKKRSIKKDKKPPKYKRKNEKMEKKKQKQFNFRCSLQAMVLLDTEIHKSVRKEHIEVLKKTPFGNLFKCFYERKLKEVQKSNDAIMSIMTTYSEDKDAFKIGKEWVKLTVDDVALTFGMPKRGKKVNLLLRGTKEVWQSDFVERHFSGVDSLNKKSILDAIKKTVILSGKTEEEDFCRLVILYMAVTIFFSNPQGSIGWSFIRHIEDFSLMNSISWPTVIHEFLMTQVKKHYKNPIHVSGCVVQLLFWLCEHVDIISPFEGSESTSPRIARWSMHDLTKQLRKQSLEVLSGKKVSLELKNISASERMLLDVEVKKKIEFDGEEEVEETIWQKNKRLKIENDQLRNRLKYLEDKVERLERGEDDNNIIVEVDMEEDHMVTDDGDTCIDQDEGKKQSRKEMESGLFDEQGQKQDKQDSDLKEVETVWGELV